MAIAAGFTRQTARPLYFIKPTTVRKSGGRDGPPGTKGSTARASEGKVVGDSVFPGQVTMATVISAIRVVELITGQIWSDIKSRYLQRPALTQALDPTIRSPSLQPQP